MKSAGRARPAEKGLSGIRHKNETKPFATKTRQSETGRSGLSRFATKFETRQEWQRQRQRLQPSAMPSRLCSGGCNLAKITAAAPDPGVPGDSGPQLT